MKEETKLYRPLSEDGLLGFGSNLNLQLDSLYDPRDAAFLTALLLGDKGSMEPNDKLIFKCASLMHMLVVSGIHVGIVT